MLIELVNLSNEDLKLDGETVTNMKCNIGLLYSTVGIHTLVLLCVL